jgi:hypothetical protein
MAYLAGLPARLDDSQLATVREIARAPLPALPPCSSAQFAAALRKLSILPRRADDDTTGEERVKVYARLLGSYPADAIGFMVRRALETLEWFPSPAQCLAIIGDWERRDGFNEAREQARRALRSESEYRWAELRERLKLASYGEIEIPQAEIDAYPDAIKRALDCEMLLWMGPSGRWEVRRSKRPDLTFLTAEDQAA